MNRVSVQYAEDGLFLSGCNGDERDAFSKMRMVDDNAPVEITETTKARLNYVYY